MHTPSFKFYALSALLLASVQAVRAEDLYVGTGVGAPDYSRPIHGSGADGSPSGFAVDVFGGYRLSPRLALETGFARLGHSSSADGTVRSKAIYFDTVGSLPLGGAWSALGRAGVADMRFTTALGNDNSAALKLGVGLQYDLGNQFAVRTALDHYSARNAFGAHAGVGDASVGLLLQY